MLLLGVQCENRKKTPQQQKAHNHNIDTQLCNRGGNPALASSHPGPAAEFSAGPRPACQAGGLKPNCVLYTVLCMLSGGQSTQIKYLSKSTDTYNKILLQEK